MANETECKNAQTAYRSLCAMLDDMQWKYTRHDEDLTITCTARGEDLPMEITIRVNADRQSVGLYSPIPFIVPQERRAALAVAVSAANYGMIDGNFDYDYVGGRIVFRMTSSFRDSLLSKDVFGYMLAVGCKTIDEYNDKFLIVAKSDMSYGDITKFIE